MEIRTIYMRAEESSKFDDAVNLCISAGWKLTRRKILKTSTPELYSMLYAELVKEDKAEGIKLSPEALEAIEINRGTSDASDYANSAIFVGIECMNDLKQQIAAETQKMKEGLPPDPLMQRRPEWTSTR